MDGDDAPRELAQARGGELAGGDLGQHRDTLLGLVVAGETGAHHLQWLVGAVDLGDQVGAHLMLDERVGAVGRDQRFGADDEQVVRHHDARGVVTHLGVDVDVGLEFAVVVELLVREREELLGGQPLPRPRRRLNAFEDRLRRRQQVVVHAAEELNAEVAEVR